MALSTQRNPSSSSSCSSSSTTPSTYDVFLSFRGEDTRTGFTDHLHAALKQKGLIVFKDDEKLDKGKSIEELFEAIKDSQYAVVVISRNFAYSTWCLKELNTMVELKKTGLKVLPVFYHVDPSDVRKQNGIFEQAFVKHSEDPKVDEKQKEVWKAALKEIGGISGWHVPNSSEATVVEQITAKIFCELHSNSSEIFENFVGLDSKVLELVSLLCLQKDDVRYIGIHGMGGVGKTILAKVLFNRIRDKFDASCFIYGTRDNKSCSIAELQEQIIHEIFKEHNKRIWNDYYGMDLIAMKLRNKRILIVFDDINQEQLEAIAGSPKWFGGKSRIIITSRDCQFWKPLVSDDNIYELKPLDQEDALQLFCWKVFNGPEPREDFVELSKNITRHAGGLPLAIKVIGSSLVGKEVVVWNSICDNLEANPHAQILDKLQLSYDWLDDLSKRLFLDIACLFNGMYVKHIILIWQSQGLYLESSIDVLRDKSLVEFSWDGHFHMHDLMQKMGQRIVSQENLKEPGKRSRLCHSDDIVHMLRNRSGTDLVEGIVWDLPLKKREQLSFEAFSKLTRLKILAIRRNSCQHSFDTLTWFGDRSKFMLSKELRVLEWEGYPLSSLRRSFQFDDLIELKLRYSSIKQLWLGGKNLNKLKYIDLSYSNLMELSDLSRVPNVEDIDLEFCTNLRKVHHSIGNLKRLRGLSLYGCKKLERFPEKISMESLEGLILYGCSKLKKFLDIVGNMTSLRKLYLGYTAIKTLPFSFQHLSSLESLSLSGWGRTDAIRAPKDASRCSCGFHLCSDSNPSSFWFLKWLGSLSSLKYLDLSCCGLLEETFPSNFSLPSLRQLNLFGNRFTKIPEFLGQLPNPKGLDLPALEVNLHHCNLFDDAISGHLGFLRHLNLGRNLFTTLPDSFCVLSNLKNLVLDYCKQLKALPKLSLNLKYLWILECSSLGMIYHQTNMEISCRELDSWFCVAVWFSAATINGYDGTPYKTIQLHPRFLLSVQITYCQIQISVS